MMKQHRCCNLLPNSQSKPKFVVFLSVINLQSIYFSTCQERIGKAGCLTRSELSKSTTNQNIHQAKASNEEANA